MAVAPRVVECMPSVANHTREQWRESDPATVDTRLNPLLSNCLRDQLGVAPGPAPRELYERLLAAT